MLPENISSVVKKMYFCW